MPKNLLVLIIQEHASSGQAIRRILEGQPSFRLQCVERQSTALARIAGGGVDVVLMDFSSSPPSPDATLDRFRTLHAAARDIPKIVVCKGAEESLARSLMQEGAADYVLAEQCGVRLAPAIQNLADRQGAASGDGTILGFAGVKGGVGATSVALNVAATLAKAGRVALWDLQPDIATLPAYFHQKPAFHGVSSLLETSPNSIGPTEVQACLWPCRRCPGLSILFGAPREPLEITPGHVQSILQALTRLANFVVVDLDRCLSPANRYVIEHCAVVALVLERDPICLPLARSMMERIDSWPHAPRLVGTVVVNRTALASPFPLADIERELGASPLGIIAPAPDLFMAAQHLHQPLVAVQPDSIAAGAFGILTESLVAQSRIGGTKATGFGHASNLHQSPPAG